MSALSPTQTATFTLSVTGISSNGAANYTLTAPPCGLPSWVAFNSTTNAITVTPPANGDGAMLNFMLTSTAYVIVGAYFYQTSNLVTTMGTTDFQMLTYTPLYSGNGYSGCILQMTDASQVGYNYTYRIIVQQVTGAAVFGLIDPYINPDA